MSFISQPINISQKLFGTARKIGDFEGYITLNESTSDILTATKHPVQEGAMITDHSFKEPVKFGCNISFARNSVTSLKQTYEELLELQASRQPIEIVTPKRVYSNMLITTLGLTTDKTTENCLAINLQCEEIIIVSVGVVQVPRSRQKNAGATGKTEKVGKKSILRNLIEGLTGR